MKQTIPEKVLPPAKEIERAYKESNELYDGIFYLGVKSTGIFCRPSCPARKPLAKNVEYFATPKEALFAGFRPCKRCRPLEVMGKLPDWVTGLLNKVEEAPAKRFNDAYLRENNIDPARARRYFMKNYGMTFQACCRGYRERNLPFRVLRQENDRRAVCDIKKIF